MRTRGARGALWVKAVAVLLVAPFGLLMLDTSKAFAAARGQRQARARVIETAKNLGVDPQALLNPDAYQRAAAAKAEKNRQRQVAAMRLRTAPDPEKLAALHQTVQEVEDAYSLHGVAALADDVADLDHALADLEHDATAGRRVLALERASFRHTDEALDKFDRAVKEQLGRWPSRFLTRHNRFMAKARTQLGGIAAQLRLATVSGSPSKTLLRRLKPKLAAVAPARSTKVRPRTPARVEPVVRAAPRGLTLFEAAAVEEQRAQFKPSPRQFLAGALSAQGGASAPGLAPLPGGLLSPLLRLAIVPLLAAPRPEDLAGTVDAPLTPEITAQAAALGHDAVRIFNFVHDTIDTEIYRGSRKGAVGTLAERAGNDTDQASLLIALLRAAGIPARYNLVGVRLAPPQWKDYTGVQTVEQAAAMLATAGFETQITELPATAGGALEAHIDVFLVSARAYVPYADYRGQATAHPGEAAWVELLPAIKAYAVQTPVDLRPGATFDFDAYLSGLTSDSPLEAWEAQLRAYALSHGLDCATLRAAQPVRTIVPEELPYLRAKAPASVLVDVGAVAELPDNFRDFVRFRYVAPDGAVLFDRELAVAELYGKRVSLTFPPATADDAAIIASFGGLEATPLYLVELKAELRVDDTVIASGAGQAPGTDNDLLVYFRAGDDGDAVLRHVTTVGGLYVWGFDPGTVPLDQVFTADTALASAAAGEAAELARLHLMAKRYFQALDVARDEVTGIFQSRFLHDTTEGLFSYEMNVAKTGGVPISGARDTVLFDVARGLTTPFAVDGNDVTRAHQKLLIGHQGSALEHITPGAFHGQNQYSAVRLVQQAHASGVIVYEFDADAVDAFLPLIAVDAQTKQAIEDTAKPGRHLRVPAAGFTPPQYRPVFGWISYDPVTGGAEYRFQGVFDGGGGGAGPPPAGAGGGCPTCGSPSPPAGSEVVLGRGNYTFDEADLTLAARGIPIAFRRAYHSFFPIGGGHLGPGWIHSYAAYLRPGASGVTFVATTGEWAFADDGAGGFTEPIGLQALLTLDITGGYVLTFREGTTWQFDTAGRLLTQQDLNGHVVTLIYDGSGLLTSVVDATGRTALTFIYDTSGRLEHVTDAAGRTVIFAHDAAGHLSQVTDVLGATKTFAYDDADHLVAKTDWSGNAWTISYDEQGRWVRTVDPLEHFYRVEYDYARGRAVHFDRTAAATMYELGPGGEELARTDALGNRTTFAYDARQNVTAKTDPRGATTTFAYDAEDNLTAEVSPRGTITQHTYGPFGRRLTTEEDVGGLNLLTTSTYDSAGNPLSTTDPSGSSTTYTHTVDGLPATITQEGGATTVLGFDADGNLTTMTDPEGGTTTFGYDAAAHLNSLEDPNQHARSLLVDAKGRILTMTDTSGAVTTFTYDDEGHRLTSVDPALVTTQTTYDALGRAIAVEDGLGQVTQTEYDAEGRVTATIDPSGARTEIIYDARGRRIAVIDADGSEMTFGYCAAESGDTPCETVDALGHVTTVAYDLEGRAVTTTDALGLPSDSTYDAAGRRLATLDPAGHLTTYGYDGAGRLVTVTDALDGVTTYGYDGRGNRTSVTDANGHTTTYTYDLANRLLTETTPIGTTWVYAYDDAGNRVSMLDPNGHTTTYVYDENRRLVARQFDDGTAHTFAYDARGSRTLEEAPAITRTLTYDALGRVSTATDHRFTPAKVLSYTYDERGNRTSMTLSPDALVTTYRWDRRGLLAELTDPDGDVERFSYDVLGRRTALRHPNGVTGHYEYNERSEVTLITWTRHTGEVLNAAGYVYDAAGNRTSKTYEDGGVEGYTYDALSRLTAVTYPAGERHVDYTYDAVGNRLSMTEKLLTNVEQSVSGCNPVVDHDCDTIADAFDNCPDTYNPGQENSDGAQFADGFDSAASLAAYAPLDTFSGGGASVWSAPSGRLAIESDDGSGDGTTYAGAYLLRSGFNDGGNLRLTAHLEAASADDGIGLAFRVQDGNNLYRFHQNFQRGFQRLEKVAGGVVTTLAATTNPVAHGVEQAFTVEASGATLRVYQGATLILSAEDAAFASGGGGVFAWQAAASTFDGLVAMPLDSRGDSCDPCPSLSDPACMPTCDDLDGDGAGSSATACGPAQVLADCAPNDSSIGAFSTEVCDGRDSDCDGRVDETCGIGTTTYAYNPFNQIIIKTDANGVTALQFDGNGNQIQESGSAGQSTFAWNIDNRLTAVQLSSGIVNHMAYDPRGIRVRLEDSDGVHDTVLDGVDEIAEFGASGDRRGRWAQGPADVGVTLSQVSDDGKAFLLADALRSTTGVADESGASSNADRLARNRSI